MLIFLDGGFDAAKAFVLRYIMTDIEHKRRFYDSKTILQEVCQAKFHQNVTYHLLGESGPDHAKVFHVDVTGGRSQIGRRQRRYEKGSRAGAAYQGLLYLKQQESQNK